MARLEIREDMDNFKAKLEKMQQEIKALAKVANTGDFDATNTRFGEAGQACEAWRTTR